MCECNRIMSKIHSYRKFSKTIKSFLKTSAKDNTINFTTLGSENIQRFKKTGNGTFMRINLKNPAKAVIPLQPIRKFVNKTIKNTKSPNKQNTSPAKPRSLHRTHSFIKGGGKRDTKRHTRRRH